MFGKTLFKNDSYLVKKAWFGRGAITVHIKRIGSVRPTAVEAEELSTGFADLNAKRVPGTENEEVRNFLRAWAATVERRVLRELGDSLWKE